MSMGRAITTCLFLYCFFSMSIFAAGDDIRTALDVARLASEAATSARDRAQAAVAEVTAARGEVIRAADAVRQQAAGIREESLRAARESGATAGRYAVDAAAADAQRRYEEARSRLQASLDQAIRQTAEHRDILSRQHAEAMQRERDARRADLADEDRRRAQDLARQFEAIQRENDRLLQEQARLQEEDQQFRRQQAQAEDQMQRDRDAERIRLEREEHQRQQASRLAEAKTKARIESHERLKTEGLRKIYEQYLRYFREQKARSKQPDFWQADGDEGDQITLEGGLGDYIAENFNEDGSPRTDEAARIDGLIQNRLPRADAIRDAEIRAGLIDNPAMAELRQLDDQRAREAARETGERMGAEIGKVHERTAIRDRAQADKHFKEGWANTKDLFGMAGKGLYDFTSDPTRIGYAVAAILTVYLGAKGVNLAMSQLKAYLNRPQLVTETSARGLIGTIVRALYPKEEHQVQLDDIVLNKKLADKVRAIARSILQAKKHGTELPNVMLYGPPGTGKSMFVHALANMSGMTYAKITGGDVYKVLSAQGKDSAVQQLQDLFTWLKANGPSVLLIDEADAFLASGRDSGAMSEGLKGAINAFLALTGSTSKRVMFVVATNYPQNIDAAVRSRISKNIHIGLPEQEERERLLKHLLHKEILRSHVGSSRIPVTLNGIENQTIISLAQRMQGWSGRDITQNYVQELKRAIIDADSPVVTPKTLEEVFDRVTEERRELAEWERMGGFQGRR